MKEDAAFFTIDVEDWYQVYRLRYGHTCASLSARFPGQLEAILDLLAEFSVQATFFYLGRTAEQAPGLVRRIVAAGHEIQSHGYGHRRVYNCTPGEFKDDVLHAKKLIEDITGRIVIGYRAPEFSIIPESAWAFEVLRECGYSYDSSVYPVRISRYGWPGFSDRPVSISFPDGSTLIEFPIHTFGTSLGRVRAGGGGAFRLYPWLLLHRMTVDVQIPGRTFYFHPYEFDADYLDIREAVPTVSLLKRWAINLPQNLFKRGVRPKVARLIRCLPFDTFGGYVARQKPESTILFSSLCG